MHANIYLNLFLLEYYAVFGMYHALIIDAYMLQGQINKNISSCFMNFNFWNSDGRIHF